MVSFVSDWWIILSRRLDAATGSVKGIDEANLPTVDGTDEESDANRSRFAGTFLTSLVIAALFWSVGGNHWYSTRGAGAY